MGSLSFSFLSIYNGLCLAVRNFRTICIAPAVRYDCVASMLQKPYDVYSFSVLPWLGKMIANDADSYRYLAESIRMHPDQEALKKMMQDAGLDCVEYFNLTAGVAALHTGIKL